MNVNDVFRMLRNMWELVDELQTENEYLRAERKKLLAMVFREDS